MSKNLKRIKKKNRWKLFTCQYNGESYGFYVRFGGLVLDAYRADSKSFLSIKDSKTLLTFTDNPDTLIAELKRARFQLQDANISEDHIVGTRTALCVTDSLYIGNDIFTYFGMVKPLRLTVVQRLLPWVYKHQLALAKAEFFTEVQQAWNRQQSELRIILNHLISCLEHWQSNTISFPSANYQVLP